MEILSGAYPPNIEEIKKVFKVSDNTVYTYGDKIYNPKGNDIDLALLAHENTHSIQQEELGVDKWWQKYLVDGKFRLAQELQAYQIQYRYYCKEVKDRNRRFRFVVRLADDLSSAMYGNIISKSEAIRLIKI